MKKKNFELQLVVKLIWSPEEKDPADFFTRSGLETVPTRDSNNRAYFEKTIVILVGAGIV